MQEQKCSGMMKKLQKTPSIFSAHILYRSYPVFSQTNGILYLVMRSNVTTFQNLGVESVDT